MSGGSSGGGGGGTTIQKTEPWDQAKPYYEKLYKTAQNAYDQVDKTPYSGQIVANQSAPTLAAQSDLLSLIPSLKAQGDSAMSLATKTANGDFLNPATNTGLQDAIQATINPTIKNFKENIVPTITDQAIASGAYGGAGNGIALGKASDSLTQNLADTIAKINYQNYATERGYQNNSPTLIAQAQQLAGAPANIEATVGAAQDAYQQELLNAQLQQYNANQLKPFVGLDELANLLNGGGYNTSTGQMSQRAATGGGLQNALMGGLGGGIIGGAAGGLGAFGTGSVLGMSMGPVGAIAGGIGGALLGGLM